MLEWMQLIDQANAWWACCMHQNYQAGLQCLQHFEQQFGVTLLQPTPLPHPPCHPSICVMWAQQHYALQSLTSVHSQSVKRVHFGTTWVLWSAVSQFYLWDHQIAHPEHTLWDPSSHKVYLAEGFSSFHVGMCTHLTLHGGSEYCPWCSCQPVTLSEQIGWVVQYHQYGHPDGVQSVCNYWRESEGWM